MVPPAPDVRSAHSRKQLYLTGLASSGKVCPITACNGGALLTEDDTSCKDESVCSERNWADLPEALLEKILSHVKQTSELQVPKAMLPACGVCSSWRAAGLRLFFASPWQDGGSICHPAGLFLLTPRPAPACTCGSSSHHSSSSASSAATGASQQPPPPSSGSASHVKCYVRREVVSSGIAGRLHKFTLYQGADFAAGDGKFLLSALQESKQRYAIYLNRALSSRPCARLACNVMRTAYNLTPERSPWMEGVLAQQAQQTRQALHLQQQEGHCSAASISDAADAAGRGAAASTSAAASSSGIAAPSTSHAAGPSSSCSTGATSPTYLGRVSSSGVGHMGSGVLGGSLGLGRLSSGGLGHSSGHGGGEEGAWADEPMARVHYKLRVRGMMLPRRMSVSLPCPSHLQQRLLQEQAAEGADGRACGCGAPTAQQGQPWQQEQQQWQQDEQDVPVPMPDLDDDLLHDVDQDVGQHGMHVAAGPSSAAGVAGPSSPALERRSHITDSPSPLPASPRSQPHAAAAGPAAAAAAAGGAAGAAGASALKLKNKPPHWNETLRCWCLNFRGRVKLASVKNFQLTVAGERAGAIAMQFGKVDKNAFILDFDPSLVTAAQAFAVALTTFESKVLL